MSTTAGKGLEGVVAATTELSYVNGTEGILEYVGIPISALAENSSFEECTFLLWHKRLPRKDELESLKRSLRNSYVLPPEVLEFIRSMPKKAHPMHVLRTAASMLSVIDPKPDDLSAEGIRAKGVSLVARFPTIIAAFDRARKGKPVIEPDTSRDLADNFLYMLNGEPPTPTMAKALDVCLILHADHGLNASTFTARVISSTLSDVYSAVTGGVGALKGPLHGGANEKVMAMLQEIGTLDNVEPYIRRKLENKEKIMGFGHRVYKTRDPRAVFLKNFAKPLADQTGNTELYEMSRKIEDLMEEAVGARGIYPNVDFYSATTYRSIGLETDLFTPMFAVSRVSGWVGHVIEQMADNRIIRPKAEYVGPHNAPYVPIEKR